LPTHAKWEKFLATLVHIFLYFAIIGMPLSGWIMSSAKNFPVSVFNQFTLPNLVGPSEEIAKLAADFHELTAYALIAAIVLHFAGAMKHHVIDKDGTLRRMIPGMYKKEGE
jgi:cytochrome b561